MLLLIYKARYKVRDPLSIRLLERLAIFVQENTDKFTQVGDHLGFIKNLRDLYRLKVAANNVIEPEYLSPVAATMGYGESADASDRLYQDFLQRTEQVGGVIDDLVDAAAV